MTGSPDYYAARAVEYERVYEKPERPVDVVELPYYWYATYRVGTV